jgi:xanthosine utilization system XapX-like protein
MLVELACSIISLIIFSLGIVLAVFELSPTAPAVLATGIGLIGLFISTALWLSAPRCLQQPFKRRSKSSISDGYINPRRTSSRKVEQLEITPDTTEVIMKSIRGIPFLIQV